MPISICCFKLILYIVVAHFTNYRDISDVYRKSLILACDNQLWYPETRDVYIWLCDHSCVYLGWFFCILFIWHNSRIILLYSQTWISSHRCTIGTWIWWLNAYLARIRERLWIHVIISSAQHRPLSWGSLWCVLITPRDCLRPTARSNVVHLVVAFF